MDNKMLIGYPSVDKPWLKYYSDEAEKAPFPKCTMYEYAYDKNCNSLDDIAFLYFGNEISFRSFFESIKITANAFASKGIRSGDNVTIMSMHTPETIISLYALNYLGAVANMAYMTLSSQEILESIKSTQSKMLLVLDVVIKKVMEIEKVLEIPIVVLSVADSMPEALQKRFPQNQLLSDERFLTWNKLLMQADTVGLHSPKRDSESTAVIVYTSGTTGKPKGVMLTNDNINAVVHQLSLSSKNYHRQETALFLLPLFYGFGLGMLHLSICVGLKSELWIEQSADKIVQEFLRFKPNRIVCGTSLIDAFLEGISGDLSFLYEFTSGGSIISAEKEKALNDLLESGKSIAKYTTGYGMTEFASVVTMNTNSVSKFQSIGTPLIGVNVKIVDTQTGDELSFNETGEICFSAPNLMSGYYNNPEETEKTITVDSDGARWMHTGDLGYCDIDGFIFFTGRLKRIYTVRQKEGTLYKLFPQRIEELIEGISGVKRCAVIVRKDSVFLHKAIAYVEAVPGESSNRPTREMIDTIMGIAKKELPEHMQPERIIVIEKIPFTSNGKIDYGSLEKMAEI